MKIEPERTAHSIWLQMMAPEGKGCQILQALRSVSAPARMETGFLCCRIWQDVENPGWISYQENWRTAADLDHQLRSERFGWLLSILEMSAVPPVLEIQPSAEIHGLAYLAGIRLEAPGNSSPSAC